MSCGEKSKASKKKRSKNQKLDYSEGNNFFAKIDDWLIKYRSFNPLIAATITFLGIVFKIIQKLYKKKVKYQKISDIRHLLRLLSVKLFV